MCDIKCIWLFKAMLLVLVVQHVIHVPTTTAAAVVPAPTDWNDDDTGGSIDANSFNKQYEIGAIMDDDGKTIDTDDVDIEKFGNGNGNAHIDGNKDDSFFSLTNQEKQEKAGHKLGVHDGIDFDAFTNDFNMQEQASIPEDIVDQKHLRDGNNQNGPPSAIDPIEMQYDETEGADIILESQGPTSKNFTTYFANINKSRDKSRYHEQEDEAGTDTDGDGDGDGDEDEMNDENDNEDDNDNDDDNDKSSVKEEKLDDQKAEKGIQVKMNRKKSSFTTMTLDKIKSKKIRNFFEKHFKNYQQDSGQNLDRQPEQQEQQLQSGRLETIQGEQEEFIESQVNGKFNKDLTTKATTSATITTTTEASTNRNSKMDNNSYQKDQIYSSNLGMEGNRIAFNANNSDDGEQRSAKVNDNENYKVICRNDRKRKPSKAKNRDRHFQIDDTEPAEVIPIGDISDNISKEILPTEGPTRIPAQNDFSFGKSNIGAKRQMEQGPEQQEHIQNQNQFPFRGHQEQQQQHHHHHHHHHQYRHQQISAEVAPATKGNAVTEFIQRKLKRRHNFGTTDTEKQKAFKTRHYGQQHNQNLKLSSGYTAARWPTQTIANDHNDASLNGNNNNDDDDKMATLKNEKYHQMQSDAEMDAVGQHENQFKVNNILSESNQKDMTTTATLLSSSSSSTSSSSSSVKRSKAYGDSFNSNGLINIKAVTEAPTDEDSVDFDSGNYGDGNDDENSPIRVVVIKSKHNKNVIATTPKVKPSVAFIATMEPPVTTMSSSGMAISTKGPLESSSAFEYHKAMRRNNKRYGHKSHKKRYKDYLRYTLIKGKGMTKTTVQPSSSPVASALSASSLLESKVEPGVEFTTMVSLLPSMEPDFKEMASRAWSGDREEKVKSQGNDEQMEDLNRSDRLNVTTVQRLLANDDAAAIVPFDSTNQKRKSSTLTGTTGKNENEEPLFQMPAKQPLMKKLTIKLSGNVGEKSHTGLPASPIFAVNGRKSGSAKDFGDKDQRKSITYSEGQVNYYIDTKDSESRDVIKNNDESNWYHHANNNPKLRNGFKALDEENHPHHRHQHHHQHQYHNHNQHQHFHHEEPYSLEHHQHLNHHKQRQHHRMKHHQSLRHNPYQRRLRPSGAATSRKMTMPPSPSSSYKQEASKEDAVHELGHQITEMEELERYYAKWPHLARVQFQVYDEHFREAHPEIYPDYDYENTADLEETQNKNSEETKIPPYIRKYNRRNKQLLDLLEGTIAPPTRPPPLRAWSNSKLQPGPRDISAGSSIVHIDNDYMLSRRRRVKARQSLKLKANPFEKQLQEHDLKQPDQVLQQPEQPTTLTNSSEKSMKSLMENQIPDEDLSVSIEQQQQEEQEQVQQDQPQEDFHDASNGDDDDVAVYNNWAKEMESKSNVNSGITGNTQMTRQIEKLATNSGSHSNQKWLATTLKPSTPTPKSALFRLPSYPAFAGNYYGKSRSRTAQFTPHAGPHFLRTYHHTNTKTMTNTNTYNNDQNENQSDETNQMENVLGKQNDQENGNLSQQQNQDHNHDHDQEQGDQLASNNNGDGGGNSAKSVTLMSTLPAITAAALPAGANKQKSVNSFIYHRVIDSTPRLLGSGPLPGRKQLLPFVAITDRRLETSKKSALQIEKDFEQNYFPMP